VNHRFLLDAGGTVVLVAALSLSTPPVAGQSPAPTSRNAETKTWSPPRTPWGDPDLAGDPSHIRLRGRPSEWLGRHGDAAHGSPGFS
jgi:hypothetical protein